MNVKHQVGTDALKTRASVANRENVKTGGNNEQNDVENAKTADECGFSPIDEHPNAKAESRLLTRTLLAEEERAAGVTTDLIADLEELGAKHGLQLRLAWDRQLRK